MGVSRIEMNRVALNGTQERKALNHVAAKIRQIAYEIAAVMDASARFRAEIFSPSEGGNYACPSCWIRDKRMSYMEKVTPDPRSHDQHAHLMLCPQCIRSFDVSCDES